MLAIVLVGASVGLDNFAAAIGIGLGGALDARLRLEVALVFGVFEGGMPVLGLLVGRGVAGRLGGHAHVIGGVVLVATGAYGLLSAWRDRRRAERAVPAGLRQLVVLGAALSIDNLVVGFALGSHKVPLALAALVIASVSVALSMLGLEFGRRLGVLVGEASAFLGGTVLVGVGAAIGFGVL